MAPKKQRLDEILIQRGLAESRTRAKALILAGKVLSGTQRLDKAGKEYPQDIELTVESSAPYVSRGGEKLDGFLNKFPITIKGTRILDVGASTGGFTDSLLQKGASESVCVDVGYGQLHYKLQNDPRVHNIERINARELSPDKLPYTQYDIIVMDLSFISLRKVIHVVWPFLNPGGTCIALVKPQFEAGKKEADTGQGIIRDIAIHERILGEIRDFVCDHCTDSRELGLVPSPITGTKGNQEYLIGFQRNP